MMFKFFKDKLKSAIDRFSKNVDKESEDAKPEDLKEEIREEPAKEVFEKAEETPEEKAGGEPEEGQKPAEAEGKEEAPEEEDKPELEPEEEGRAEKEPEEPGKKPAEEYEPETEGKQAESEKKGEEEPKKEEKAETEAGEKEDKAEEEAPAEEEKPAVEENAEDELYEEKKPAEEPKKPEKRPVEAEKPEEKPQPEEQSADEPVPGKNAEPATDKKGLFARIRDRVTHREEKPEEKTQKERKPVPEAKQEEQKKPGPPEPKKGLLKKVTDSVTKKSISESKFNDLFWELEIVLLENNVAVDVIEKIKEDLRQELVDRKVRFGKTQDVIIESLTRSIESLFDAEKISLLDEIGKKKPYVILFVGVNGVGKTTTIAKMANMLQKNKKTCVIAAADTFRAAAIQQLEEHAKRLGTKLIKHDYGSDPAAVAFDAIKYAKSKDIDVVLVDTAGRQHSNTNLMEEMKKMGRVASPDLKIFVGESITGNDCIVQATKFNEAVGIDGIILSKADVDDKGGAAISVSYVTKKPILYLGTGQDYDSLQEFDREIIIKNLGLA